MTTKKCSKCGEVKSLDEFSADKRALSGKQSCCKVCQDMWRKRNIERVRLAKRVWCENNREKVRAYDAASRLRSIQSRRLNERLRYAANKDHFQEKVNATRIKHAAKIKSSARIKAEFERNTLADHYVISTLRSKSSDVTPELLEMQRTKIWLRRMTKQLINTIKDKRNDD